MNTGAEYFVTGGAILTGEGPAADMALEVRGGMIEGMVSKGEVHAGLKALDFPGCTVTPLFKDYHMHLFCTDPAEKRKAVRMLVRHGIGTVYDGGSRSMSGLDMRAGNDELFSVTTAGCALYKRGGYGNYIGKGASDMREAEAVIDFLKAGGVDYLKVVNSGIYDPEGNGITGGGFERDELELIVSYAKSSGLEVFCHANGPEKIYDAVRAGASSVIHGLRIDDETMRIMAGEGTAFIPTINAFAALKGLTGTGGASRNIENEVKRHMEAVKKASDMGVRVLPGSDAGAPLLPYGESYKAELSTLLKAGICYKDVLMSAAGRHFSRGMRPSFLVLDGFKVKAVHLCGVPAV